MKYKNCMIAYNHGGPIEVGLHPDRDGWSDEYTYTVGACFAKVHKATDNENLIQLLLEFHHAVVRDKVPLEQAHAAFWEIDEYRDAMAEDIRPPKAA